MIPSRKEVTEMKLEYMQAGDYLIPNIVPNTVPEQKLGKYGRMRRKYLDEHRHRVFAAMLLKGELKVHCLEVEKQANDMLDTLIEQKKKAEGVTEELKASDQMEWVRRMEMITAEAEEVVLSEVIFA
ncbi:MAG: TnpV protein [Lachnospiraceae bacterium]|nr:TnpV protein [Lachnospiraceae bacterium]